MIKPLRPPYLFFAFVLSTITLFQGPVSAEETVVFSGKTFLENDGTVILRPITGKSRSKKHARDIRTKLDGRGGFSLPVPRASFPLRVILPLKTSSTCERKPSHPFFSAMVSRPEKKSPITIGILSSLRDLRGAMKTARSLSPGNTWQDISRGEKILDHGITDISLSGTSPGLIGWGIVQDLSDGRADGLKIMAPIPLCDHNAPSILATTYLSRSLLASTDKPDQKKFRTIAIKFIQHLEHMAPSLGKERKAGPSLSVPRDSGALIALSDGQVVSLGGEASEGIVGTVEVFHPSTGLWDKSIPDYPIPLAYTAVAPLPGNGIFVSGGFNSNGIVKEAFIYSPTQRQWKPIAPDPVSRMGAVTVALPNGNIIVIGGQAESGFLSLNEEYSIKTGKWKTLPPAPTARMGGTGVLLNDGRVLFMGGFEADKGISGSGNIYDPGSRTWSGPIETGPVPRLYATSLLLPDGRVLMADGFNRSGVLNTLDIYDPSLNQWDSHITPDITKRKELGAALLPDGSVMLAGGEDAGGNSIGAVTLLK